MVLPAYLPACRWFAGQGHGVREVRLIRQVPLGSGPDRAAVHCGGHLR